MDTSPSPDLELAATLALALARFRNSFSWAADPLVALQEGHSDLVLVLLGEFAAALVGWLKLHRIGKVLRNREGHELPDIWGEVAHFVQALPYNRVVDEELLRADLDVIAQRRHKFAQKLTQPCAMVLAHVVNVYISNPLAHDPSSCARRPAHHAVLAAEVGALGSVAAAALATALGVLCFATLFRVAVDLHLVVAPLAAAVGRLAVAGGSWRLVLGQELELKEELLVLRVRLRAVLLLEPAVEEAPAREPGRQVVRAWRRRALERLAVPVDPQQVAIEE